jgi:hypothetical protein
MIVRLGVDDVKCRKPRLWLAQQQTVRRLELLWIVSVLGTCSAAETDALETLDARSFQMLFRQT